VSNKETVGVAVNVTGKYLSRLKLLMNINSRLQSLVAFDIITNLPFEEKAKYN